MNTEPSRKICSIIMISFPKTTIVCKERDGVLHCLLVLEKIKTTASW